jgi:hypothetical protein
MSELSLGWQRYVTGWLNTKCGITPKGATLMVNVDLTWDIRRGRLFDRGPR